VQIDAAINPGNSGGPGFADLHKGEVVGVAFSRHKNAEATGYIIPYVVVEHFLESYRRHSTFTGLCCLGMLVQRLENPSLRRYHQARTARRLSVSVES
jgi:S1-C subfamily serine protease